MCVCEWDKALYGFISLSVSSLGILHSRLQFWAQLHKFIHSFPFLPQNSYINVITIGTEILCKQLTSLWTALRWIWCMNCQIWEYSCHSSALNILASHIVCPRIGVLLQFFFQRKWNISKFILLLVDWTVHESNANGTNNKSMLPYAIRNRAEMMPGIMPQECTLCCVSLPLWFLMLAIDLVLDACYGSLL